MSAQVGGHGFGNVGLGVAGEPNTQHSWPPLAERHAWCAENEHPSATFNPWSRRTWCLCGSVARDGNTVSWPLPMQCGGPLTTCLHLQT